MYLEKVVGTSLFHFLIIFLLVEIEFSNREGEHSLPIIPEHLHLVEGY